MKKIVNSSSSILFAALVVLAGTMGGAGAGVAKDYVSKAEYLDLMEAAVSAYSDEHIARYVEKTDREGVEEHGFPRLTANIGVLVANGRLPSKRETFRRMMTISCRDAAKGPMKREGNEFSVKELAIALGAVERAGLFEKSVTDAWRADLKKVEPARCYRCLPPVGAKRANNWCVFGCASEQARIAEGLDGNAAHIEKYVSDQMRWFDANGMYKDPDQPAVYDLVTRLQFMAVLHFGYNGPSRAALEAMLDKAAEPTLAMLSACGEIPYGGRSNQFLHNHTFYAAVCEWYAARFRAKGDEAQAVRFRLAAREAVDALREWLDLRPMRHIKNFYPLEGTERGSGIGCEGYAYFNKYMVTMGSWAMLGWMLSDDSLRAPTAQERDLAAHKPPLCFATTPDFHWVFLRAGDYSAQFDYNADWHYDCDGLSRIQRRGAPATIFMSVPCAKKPGPGYKLEHPNFETFSMMPVGVQKLVPAGCGQDATSAWADWKAGEMDWKCRLTEKGLASTLTGPGHVALSLPAFAFDGARETEIVQDGQTLAIRYRGWTCSYTTDGEIVDTGKTFYNRNGRYRAFEARGDKSLKVDVAITRNNGVVVWPAAPGTTEQGGYSLTVNGTPVDVMAVPKSTCYSEDKAFPYSYALFDADEEVLVEIRSPLDMSRARILPQRSVARDIRATKDTFSFRAKPPFTLAVEPLRTRHRALILSAGLPEKNAPREGDAGVVFYGPGRHRLDEPLELGDGQTLYLAPGAWLEGAIRAKGDNVTICGRGVISGLPWEHRKGPAHDMVNLSGRNVTIRDVTLMGSWFYTLALENVSGGLVENVKVLGGRCNNDDGIDPIAARDVTIRDCFVRTHDDCIAPKDWIENLLVERCCLWADGANTIRLGFECAGGPSKPFRKIRFRDIEILHLSMNNDKPPDAYWVEAAVHLQPSNGMVFEDIVFENFNFDFCPQAMDMLLVVRTHPCRNGAPHPHKEGGHVRNVTFRNFNLPPRRPLGALGIWLQSIDPTHAIEDITFENMSNFEVPVGIRGVARNIRGLPRGIVRDETGSWRDYEAWRPYKTRIACIGDSITYGFGLKNRERDAYPAQLQRMLDEKFPGKYEVRNFGNPGRGVYTHTKFKGTCRAFASVPEHALALAWHPDIVICNLGANDWGEIGKEGDGRLAKGTFAREYHALLDEYRKLSTKPKIVLWTALAPLGKAHGARGKPCVETLNAELVRFAGEENLPGIDMRTPLANDIESLVLKDGIHPNPEGSRRIAEKTLTALFSPANAAR